MTLSTASKVAYNQREKTALALLRSRRVVTPELLEKEIWEENDIRPFNARNIAAGVLRSLKAKAERNREPWQINVVNHGRLGSKWELKK